MMASPRGYTCCVVGLWLACACGARGGAADVASARDASAQGDAAPASTWIGQAFPTPTLSDCEGEAVDLGALFALAPASWVVLHRGTCPTCRDQKPFLVAFDDEYGPRGAQTVVVLGDDALGTGHVDAAFCRAYGENAGFTFPLLRDDDFGSLAGFAGSQTPVQLVVDGQGIVSTLAAGWKGAASEAWIRGQVEALLP